MWPFSVSFSIECRLFDLFLDVLVERRRDSTTVPKRQVLLEMANAQDLCSQHDGIWHFTFRYHGHRVIRTGGHATRRAIPFHEAVNVEA